MKQNQAIEEYNKMLDAQEKKRPEDWANQQQKIKDAMSRMADTILKKSNAAKKQMEKRAVQYANQKDMIEAEREKEQKQAARNRNIEIKKTLKEFRHPGHSNGRI